jgi:5-phospho-D-xylono-1,4-lactonase
MTVPAFIRTVLGDIEPSALGMTYCHEHLVIDGGRPVEMNPDFLLDDVDRMTAELNDAVALGLGAAVDAMPADAGRSVTKLAELSRRTGVHIVAATGLHHDRFYSASHWSVRLDAADLANLFSAEVQDGIDAHDYSGPVVRRTKHRAGVVKVAGSEGGLSVRDTRIFAGAAETHLRTGVPILTHCEAGTGALEQLRFLGDRGVPAEHVILSHIDKVVDVGYHREILASGAYGEYDQAFRWGERPNGTLDLIEAMAGVGLADRIVLGMDAARQGYYRAYGGWPGLTYLLDAFSAALDERDLGSLRSSLFIDDPARALAFAPGPTDEGSG